MGALTDLQIRKWIKGGKPLAKADGGGLTLTISAKGTAAWVLRYRVAGKPRELTMGNYPDLTLAKARELAAVHRVAIQQGRDPAREKQEARAARATAQTFKALAADYMNKVFPRLAENTVKQRRYHIEKLIAPKLGAIPAREITPGDIVQLIEQIGKKSINVAELVFTALNEIFKHGQARHAVIVNPCAGIAVSAICGKAKPARQRLKLTEDELRVILPALPDIGPENALAVKILLTTCTRIGELTKAEWDHLDFDRAQWIIPDENSKTDKGFIVPLPPAVIGWFNDLRPFSMGSKYVLPARNALRRKTYGRDIHFDQRAINSMLNKLCDKLGDKVRRFTPHDLRSTARSYLGAMGISVIVAERCLNHSLGGLVGIYDQHDYLEERRAALELWTSFILACEDGRAWLPAGANVVPMRRAAR